MIIYKFTNKINNKEYIGQTIKSLKIRISEHLCAVNKGRSYLLYRAIRKYGFKLFEISIIDTAETQKVLIEKEIYWIKYYNTKIPYGYNMTDGGEGSIGRIQSKECRAKISAKKQGIHLSDETKKKMSEIRKGKRVGDKHPMFGKHHSEETKAKMSKALSGRRRSKEIRKKISESHIGKKHSPETIKKMSDSQKNIMLIKKELNNVPINY